MVGNYIDNRYYFCCCVLDIILQAVLLQHLLIINNNPFSYGSIYRFLNHTENLAKSGHISHLQPLAYICTEVSNSML